MKKLESRGSEGEEDVFDVAIFEETVLRKQLAEIEDTIAGLVDDLKFECEPYLLAS